MKILFIIVVVFLLSWTSGAGQVRPDQFPEELNPTNSNFEVYSQKNGNVRKASLVNLKKYFTPEIELTPILYVPEESGNLSDRMKYVVDPNDNVWFIDAEGDALMLRGEGKVYVRQTVANFSSNTYIIPANAVDLRVYIGGLLQEANGADYTRDGTNLNFTWTPPGLRLTLIYKQ